MALFGKITIAFGLLFGGSTTFATVYQSLSGPASVTVEFDRYSGSGEFALCYNGYLHSCDTQDTQSVNVHLIFHTDEGTRMFVRPMHNMCNADFIVNDCETHLFRTLDFQGSNDRELWQYLRKMVNGEGVLETAFEKSGHWDSDHGKNFRIQF